jgi:gliding motility-associated-like protein
LSPAKNAGGFFMKRVFIILIFLACLSSLYAQKETANWYFGWYSAINFNDSGVVALTDSKISADALSGTISDASGNLLFYTNGINVWNKEHKVMQNGTGLKGFSAGVGIDQNVIIVPWPSKKGFYFIFTNEDNYTDPLVRSELYYSVVDMAQDSGRGAIVSKNIFLMTNATRKMNAIMHSNGKAVWLVTHEAVSDNFVSFLIDQNGVNSSKIYSKGNITLTIGSVDKRGYIKVSPGSDLLVHCTYRAGKGFEICKFDNSKGTVTECINLQLAGFQTPTTSEFSPSGKYLYIGLDQSYNILQYDVSVWDSATIKKSEKVAGSNVPHPTINNYPMGIQVGMDGKIYVTSYYQIGAYLGVIQYPEKSGTACNYIEDYLYLKGGQAKFGLPNFIQSYFFIPEFSAEHTCFGDTTLFSITDTSHVDSVLWDFGDTNTGLQNFATQTNLYHVFSDTGIFKVQVFLWHDAGETDTLSREIRISPYPIANFGINDPEQCLKGNQFIFTDRSTIIADSFSWEWDFGDSNKLFVQNPVYTYGRADTFDVKLIILSDYGCEASLSKRVYVHPSPISFFAINDRVQCFNEQLFVVSDSSVVSGDSISNYSWYIDSNSLSNQQIVTLPHLNPATWNLKLVTTTAHGCTDTTTQQISVHPSPIADFSINDSLQCFNENSFQFTNHSNLTGFQNLLGLEYRWDLGDQTFSSDTHAVKTYLLADTFWVELVTESAEGCKDSVARQIIVLESPIAAMAINDTAQCYNEQQFVISDQSTVIGDSIVGNQWVIENDTQLSNLPTFQLSNMESGTWNIQLVTSTSQGCTDTSTQQISVHPSPTVDFRVNDSIQCLNENNFQFTNHSNLTGFQNLLGLTYRWDLGDQTFSNDTHTVKTYLLADTFWVELVAESAEGCKDSVAKQIIVLESPKAAMTVNDSSQCLSGNEFSFSNIPVQADIVAYTWNFGDTTQSQDSNPVKSYLYADTFFISLILSDSFGCKDTAYKEVFVRPMPIAAFTINDTSQCLAGNNFNFNNTSILSSGTLTHQWYYRDTLIDTLEHLADLKTSQPGIFIIKLIVESEYACVDSTQQAIFINPMPKANFSYCTPCLEKEITFTDKSQLATGSINNWKWYFTAQDSSALQNPVFTFTDFGDHAVQLIVQSDSGCLDTLSKTITIYDHAPAVVVERVTVVNDQFNLLEWKAPSSPIVSGYRIQKSSDFGNFIDLKTYPKDSLSLSDFSVSPDYHIYTYHILTEDSCGHVSDPSNIAQSILLELDSSEAFNILSWSAYEEWTSGVERYEVQIFNAQSQSWEKLEAFPFPVAYSDSANKISQAEYCYRIAAFRTLDDLPSHSNVVCSDTRMNLFVPNAFSPNGDGKNDVFQVRGTYLAAFELKIFNRWGELLFESNSLQNSWDGTFKNKKCPMGVYYFQLKAKGIDNQKVKRTGNLTILK